MTSRVIVRHAQFPVALVALPNGALLYAERLSGAVRRITANGHLEPETVARVRVSVTGQRGLLGLAVSPDGRLFVAYTRAEGAHELEVDQLKPTRRVIWRGPSSARLANGGHLDYDRSRRRLVLGVGDLLEPARVRDPNAANGKILLLDPGGPSTQRPTVLSSGWNNPFAFVTLTGGAIWVADNVPGETGERLARGDLQGRPTYVTSLPVNTVPSALTAPAPRTLIVCSYARGHTITYAIRHGRASRVALFGDDAKCRTGLASGPASKLWLSDEHTIIWIDHRQASSFGRASEATAAPSNRCTHRTDLSAARTAGENWCAMKAWPFSLGEKSLPAQNVAS